jgi:putative ubiquitin-RnfH superfamily antitoxin RatB of RatAB toxin-antitoxin module
MRVEVACALPQGGIVATYELPASATVEDALRAAGADPAFAGIDLDRSRIGVFGTPVHCDQPLNEGDRVEIYRPLAIDPKAARRARVKQARSLPGPGASKSGRS